jgi:hypothetical protein
MPRSALHYGRRMTMAQVQPLNIPTASELTKAHDFLCEAVAIEFS